MKINSQDDRFPINVIITTFLPHLSTCLVLGAIGALAPFLQSDLGINRAQIGLLASAHSFGWIALALVSGGLIERSGVRLWLFLSPVITGVFALFFGYITSFTQGFFVFFILGALFSFVNPATTKAIIESFPVLRRGTAIALKQTGGPAGVFLASVFLPVTALLVGWKISMTAVAAINVMVGILGWILYVDRMARPGSETGVKHSGNFRNDLISLFKNRDFLLISFLQGIFNMVQFVLLSYLVLFLMESIGYSAVHAGFVMAVTQVLGIIGRIVWGVMSDFVFTGKRVPTLQVASLTTVIGLVGLAMIGKTTPAWIILIVASLAGAGSIGFGGTAILLRAELAGRRMAATSTSIGMAIGAWGIVLGPPLFGFIVDVTNSYTLAWEMTAVVSLAAVVLLRFIHEHKQGKKASGD